MRKNDNDDMALTEYERAAVDAVESLTRHLRSSDARPEERETSMFFTMIKDGRAKSYWGGHTWQLSLSLCSLMRDEPDMMGIIMGTLFAFVDMGYMSRDSLVQSLDRYLAISAAYSSPADGDSSPSKKTLS